METSDHYLAVAAAIFAFGTGIGEIFLQSTTLGRRRFGRAVKISATLGGGLFAVYSVFDPKGATANGTAGVTGFSIFLFVYIFLMMYRLEGRGKLKEPE